jgi:sulfite reductase (NADPH) hemoprotein beta-component
MINAIREVAESGFFTINGCGDNTRNVVGCPLSHNSPIFDANKWAQKAGKYFALPISAYIEVFEVDPNYLRKAGLVDREPDVNRFNYAPNQLNRKFKIAFSAIHYDEETKKYLPDNCVELRTNDIGVAPIINSDGNVDRFQVYVGGSQGTQAGKPTYAALGEPFGIFTEENLMRGLDAIVRVHQEWGDRQNRHWARLKYVIKIKGIEWFREQVRELGVDFELSIPDFDYGDRNLHLGWTRQPSNKDLWCYGAFIENGRIVDGSPNGDLQSMVRYIMNNYHNIELLTTPNQHLLFTNIEENMKGKFENDMKRFGYGARRINGEARQYSKLRILSGACVGRDTCKLTYTDSEKFEPYLIDELEKKWRDMAESIGITGCEKQCYRPATKTIGWIGSGFNLYQLTLFGTEDARHQGVSLMDPDTEEQYLHFVPRKDVVTVTDALFEYYVTNRSQEESRPGRMGYFFRRVGAKEIISHLKSNPKTADLMKKTFKER